MCSESLSDRHSVSGTSRQPSCMLSLEHLFLRTLSLVRYPKIRVRTDSENPFALVAAVREELRLARVGASEIDRFSEQALSQAHREAIRNVCKAWVDLGD